MLDRNTELGSKRLRKPKDSSSLSDSCYCDSYSDTTHEPTTDTALFQSQGSLYFNSNPDVTEAKMSLLKKAQEQYKESGNVNLIKTHISRLICQTPSLLNNSNENFQIILEELSKEMLISEFEFLCICTYFHEFADKLKGTSVKDVLITAFFVIKSKLERDNRLIKRIKQKTIDSNPLLNEKVSLFLDFELNITNINKVFAYYKKEKYFKPNYCNVVSDILRNATPYNCKPKLNKTKIQRKAKNIKTKDTKIRKLDDKNSEYNNDLKFNFDDLSPIHIAESSYGEVVQDLYLGESRCAENDCDFIDNSFDSIDECFDLDYDYLSNINF